MARVKLTKRVVEAAEVPSKESGAYFIWDEDLRGFGVRIFPSGIRTYWINYKNQQGSRTRMTIGAHGALTCDEARTLAKMHLGDTARGADPAEERRTRRRSLTVGQLCDQYLADAQAGMIRGRGSRPKKATTLATDAGRVSRHIKPLLGKRLVIDLTLADITRFHKDVTVGKTAMTYKTGQKLGNARVTGGAGTARRTTGFLGAVLEYARREGIIDFNPARGVEVGADGVRDRRLLPDEYRALGRALEAAEAGGEHWQVIAGVRLLALTGCRLGEVEHLTAPEIDRAGSCIRLKDSKTGPSVRPAGRAVFDVLDSLAMVEGNEFVLPSIRKPGKRFGGIAAGIDRVMARANLEAVTAHTLRHSYASTAADLGFSLPTIAALLGHQAGTGVTQRYVHMLDAVLLASADRVSKEIWRMMTGATAQVHQFPRAG